MQLDKLLWRKLADAPDNFMCADPKDKVHVCWNTVANTYSVHVISNTMEPLESWERLDAITAQAVLYELLKE